MNVLFENLILRLCVTVNIAYYCLILEYYVRILRVVYYGS